MNIVLFNGPYAIAVFHIRLVHCDSHKTDKVVDADDVALRTSTMGEHRRIAGFRIAPLRVGAVDVNKVVVTGVSARRTCIRRATNAGTAHARTNHAGAARPAATAPGTALALRWLQLIQPL